MPPVFHTNFRLSRSGAIVVLANSRGEIQDRIDYPAQAPDVSYGRNPNGTGSVLSFLNPTPPGP
ncbi:MAG: hypothetical protein IH787_01560, partial [Nitrospirae bacterium]|nr:hypothetical protein [Nitrospirota bacterium]